MVDIIVPKERDLIKSKEMHGHLKLDIHNTNSGFTERIEVDNTVTTAANEFMWLNYLAYLRNDSAQRPKSLYTGIYGGVCLFTDEISGGNMLPFGSNHLVGYAGTSTTVSGNRGVYNVSESSVSSGSATTVWDWGTSQANGTIGAVARTNSVIGNGYIGMEYSNSSTNMGIYSKYYRSQDDSSISYQPIGFDKTNGIVYMFNASTSKYYMMPYHDNLTVDIGTLNSAYVPMKSSSITTLCDCEVGGDRRHKWLNADGTKLYTAKVTTSGTSSDGVVTIYSVDLTADTIVETSTDVTMQGCYLYSDATTRLAFSDGYLYIVGYNPDDTSEYGIYQLKLSDNSINFFDVAEFLEDLGYTQNSNIPSNLTCWGTGGISFMTSRYLSGTTSTCEILLEQDGTMIADEPCLATTTTNIYGCRSMAIGAGNDAEMALVQYNNTAKQFLPFGYLATYANLGTSITKTASETLKLTYVLSDS